MGLDVDAVIAHHPHVAQPLVHQNNKWLAFSLGNFVFDIEEHLGRSQVNEGLIIEVKFNAAGIECTGVPVQIDPKNATLSLSKLSTWQETQSAFYQHSYWLQWTKECNHIRNEERILTQRNSATSVNLTDSKNSFLSKWSSLFNAPRRSLFFGDVCYRLFFRYL